MAASSARGQFGATGASGVPANPATTQHFITIATGAVTGVYYDAGEMLCRQINRERARHGIRCSVESTAAAIHNLRALRRNDVQFAFAQADTEQAAVAGRDDFATAGADRTLRVVAGLHTEAMSVVVRKGAAIHTLGELRNRRVSLGIEGSGTRFAAKRLLAAHGLRPADLARVESLKPDEHTKALCAGRIDAFMFWVGHPSRNLEDTARACPIWLLPVERTAVERLTASGYGYHAATLPAGLYAGMTAAVPTIGGSALLLTHASVPDDVVREVARALFDNLEQLKRRQPALANLDAREMANVRAAAPWHPGVFAVFAERRLR